MTSHCITWHDTTQAITSHQMTWPSHDLTTPQQTSRHQNTSLQSTKHHHHGTAEGSFTAKKWFGHRAGRSPCAHSIGKFFLHYIVLFLLETSAPGLSGYYWYLALYWGLILILLSISIHRGSTRWTSHHIWATARFIGWEGRRLLILSALCSIHQPYVWPRMAVSWRKNCQMLSGRCLFSSKIWSERCKLRC